MPLRGEPFEKAAEPAWTREPGDLPDAVVFRSDRVCGADGVFLDSDIVALPDGLPGGMRLHVAYGASGGA
ncbi:hypothetical protein FHW92_000219 [Novosphingobium sp. SG707]|nr:hypothetical protein [Novosphingobium sp. SG707]